MTFKTNVMTSVQATILSAIISTVVALIVVFINKYFESRKSKSKKYDTVKKYANPIVLASEQLAWRLKEILESFSSYIPSFVGIYLRGSHLHR